MKRGTESRSLSVSDKTLHNNSGETLIGRGERKFNLRPQHWRRNTIATRIRLTGRHGREATSCSTPLQICEDHEIPLPIYPPNQPIAALDRRSERSICETGDRIWESSFDSGTPDDAAYYRREPAETLLNYLLAECNQFACLVPIFLFMFKLF